MNEYKKQFIFTLIMMLIVGLMIAPINPVLAVEIEEEDNFTTMPNYRWENETTTSTEVQEQIIGDQYEVYNQNNESTGIQQFAKSRPLNSRDFYFDSRFQLDIGGNQTEYFRDVVGDAADFDEGDQEGSESNQLNNDLVANGIFSGNPSAFQNIQLWIDTSITINAEVYTRFKIRIKIVPAVSTEIYSVNFLATTQLGVGKFIGLSSIETNVWNEIDVEITDSDWLNGRVISSIQIRSTAGTTHNVNDFIAIDSIELIGSLDYATHIEDIGDTWDWEDSLEYFYDDFGNISDFNDGTTEDYTSYKGSIVSTDGLGQLKVEDASGGGMQRSGLSIDSSVYSWIAIEFIANVTIFSLTAEDGSGNTVSPAWGTTFAADTYHFLSGDFSLDGDWTGTETGLRFDVSSTGGVPFEVLFNFTFLYDVELGDREGFTGYTSDANAYTYVNPNGWLVARKVSPTGGWGAVRIAGLSILADNFDLLVFRMRSTTATTIGIFDPSFNSFGNIDLTTDWQVFTIDLSDKVEWTGTETGLIWRDAGAIADNQFSMDYVLLLGHYKTDQGFKFSLLNQNKQEGMYFQFTRNLDQVSEYTMHVDMLDSVGISMAYEKVFNYSRDVDGWLRLDVEWHLDKKKLKFVLEYENGSDIVNTRTITDIYGLLTRGQLLLLKDGFPELCLNNSLEAISRSLILIDYIDADWRLTKWDDPAEIWTEAIWDNLAQDPVSDFDSITPYGFEMANNEEDKSHWFRTTVDRFDGMNFRLRAEKENTESLDSLIVDIYIYNVQLDGSLLRVVNIDATLGTTGPPISQLNIKDSVDTIVSGKSGTVGSSFTLQASFYYQNASVNVLQYHWVCGSNDEQATVLFTSDGLYTKEYVFVFAYRWNADVSVVGGDDNGRAMLTGLEFHRKDIIGDIVQLIIVPLGQVLAFILSPLIIIINLLGFIISRALGLLGDVLKPAIDLLGTVLGGIFTAVGDSLGALLSGIGSTLSGLAASIWNVLLTLSGDIITFVESIITGLLGTAEIMIAAWEGFLDDLSVFLWDNWLFPLIDSFFADLGINFVLDAIILFLDTIGTIIEDVFTIIGVWLITVISYVAFWLDPNRFVALALTVGAIITAWVFIPAIKLFMDSPLDEWAFGDIADALSEVFTNIWQLLDVAYRITITIVELMYRTVSAIGNFIPFT